jgi:hypothetical protein
LNIFGIARHGRKMGSQRPDDARMSSSLRDLFRWYGIPPSLLHAAIQDAAKQAGWTPPWDQEQQTTAKKRAGRKSAGVRANRASIRRLFVKEAFGRLKRTHQFEPFAGQSLAALTRAYREVLAEDGHDPTLLMKAAPFKAGRETLKADLKALGIRSKRRAQRPR